MILNYTLSYLAYVLGALIFLLDEAKKYQDIANANPDTNIIYNKKSFWAKEKLSVIKVFLVGIVSVIIFPMMFNGNTVAFQNQEGQNIWSMPLKAAQIPAQILIGYGGGRAIIAWLGKSKKELYKKVGIEEDK